MNTSPGSHLVLIHKRFLHLAEQDELELRTEPKPFDAQTRARIERSIKSVRGILPTDLRDSLPDGKGDCEALHRSLQAHNLACRKWLSQLSGQGSANVATSVKADLANPELPRFSNGRCSLLAFAMAAWCVVLAVADFSAIWPYQVSRWVLCFGAIVLAVNLGEWRSTIATCTAIVFNPIAPIHFGDVWPVIDALAAIALVGAAPVTVRLFRSETWVTAWAICGPHLYIAYSALFGLGVVAAMIFALYGNPGANSTRREKAGTSYPFDVQEEQKREYLNLLQPTPTPQEREEFRQMILRKIREKEGR